VIKPPRPEYWWKVVVDGEGKVVSCDVAIDRGEDHNSTFFVRARDIRGAGRLAFNAYMRVVQKARHARLKRDGLCRCGKPNDSGTGSRCIACKQRDSRYAKRARAKGRGEDVEPLDRVETLHARRAAEVGDIRLATLREANRRFLADRAGFSKWILGEIEKLTSKERAA
jgi:hypothetical protein